MKPETLHMSFVMPQSSAEIREPIGEKPTFNSSQTSAKAAPAVPKPKQMTDNEWLDAHCSKILGILPFKNAFKQDALLYRRLSEKDKFTAFRRFAKKLLADARKPGSNGLFFSYVYRIVHAAHPMHWLMCDGCNGNGHVPVDKTKACPKCMGGGYKVTYEQT